MPRPSAAIPSHMRCFCFDPGRPSRLRYELHPGAIDPINDVQVPARPETGGARSDDVSVAVGRASRRGGEGARLDRQVDEAIEQVDCLVVGDILLGLV
jgi:hypothetical protein